MNWKLLIKGIGVGILVVIGTVLIFMALFGIGTMASKIPAPWAFFVGCIITVVGVTAIEYYNKHKGK